ncbi:MAG: hypothetical protein ACD_79C00961G0005 [uncultured bacterium]|nr:MAG: hypothetical protein ACD_79C00961G0005 [uncultured bacterium]
MVSVLPANKLSACVFVNVTVLVKPLLAFHTNEYISSFSNNSKHCDSILFINSFIEPIERDISNTLSWVLSEKETASTLDDIAWAFPEYIS